MAAEKVRKLNPKQQHLIDLAGQIDPDTGNEYTIQKAVRKVGYSASTANVNIHSKGSRWLKELWEQRVEKIRDIRRKATERGIARAEEKRAFDTMDQAKFWASFSAEKTGGRIQGQVNATRLVAEMEGRIVQRTEVNDLRGKSAEELEFIRVYKRLPIGNELQEFIASGTSGAIAGPKGTTGSDGAGGPLPS